MTLPRSLRARAHLVGLSAALLASLHAADKPPAVSDLYTAQPLAPYYAFQPTMIAPGSETIQRRSEASAANLKNGNVLVAWCDLVGHSDNAKGYIVAQELAPDGKPLGEPRSLFPTPEGGLNVLSPAIRRLKDGKLGLAFSYRMSTQSASRQFSVSADEGITWSKTVPVSDGSDPYMTGCNDRLSVLESGRLVAPLHCTDDWDKHHLHVKVARSDDNGATWKTTAQKIELPLVRWPENKPGIESGCIEPGIAQRADGSLLMTFRTAMGTQFFSESADQGETWTAPRSLELISPQAPANLTRIPGSNDLLMVWTPSYEAKAVLGGKRNTIMVAVSKDGGRSWPHAARKILVHDPEHSIDYPSVLYRGNEVWITLRTSSGAGVLQGLTSTQLMRVPLAWFQQP
jgi:Neuraminidase (sialidase)